MVAPTRYYLPDHLLAERELTSLMRPMLRIKADHLPWEDFRQGLFDEQADALHAAATSRFLLLYGVPGSGKTTTLGRVVQMFDSAGLHGVIMAPTGKAAKRADEVLTASKIEYSNRPDCKTTFRGLGFNPGTGKFEFNEANPLDYDYVILEESSFLDGIHGRDIFLAIDPTRTRVIMVGDPYQLPPVGSGCIFRDLIDSHRFTEAKLSTPRRQGAQSGIVYNANRVLNGLMPSKVDLEGTAFTDWFFNELLDEDEAQRRIVGWVKEKIPARYGFDAINDIQVISPGKKGKIGTKDLNDVLREALNPGPAKFRGFRLNDKVINRKTAYTLGIYNGDVGRVKEIGNSGMVVDFGAGAGLDGTGVVEITGDYADSIKLNYAGTVHSSQGSEYKCQITPLYRTHYRLLSRNLLYTAMTRAKQLSMLIGDSSALTRCIEFSQTVERMTGLQDWLSMSL